MTAIDGYTTTDLTMGKDSNKDMVVYNNGNSMVLDEVSASDLFSLEKPVNLAVVVVGYNEKRLFLDFELPAPTDKDLKWAESIYKKTAKKREKELLKSIKNNELWRIAYLVKVYQDKDFNKDWLDPNSVRHTGLISERSLLSSVVEVATKEGAALFLQCKDVDVNKTFYIDELCDRNALHYLLERKNEPDTSAEILRMLVGFDLKVYQYNVKRAKTATIRSILEEVLEEQKLAEAEKKQQNNKNLLEHKTEETENRENNTVSEEGAIWTKLANKTICKLTNTADGFRLRKIFNFNSASITEIGEYLDEEGKITTTTQPVIISMVQEFNKTEIKQAQKILKEMNKKTKEDKNTKTSKKKIPDYVLRY